MVVINHFTPMSRHTASHEGSCDHGNSAHRPWDFETFQAAPALQEYICLCEGAAPEEAEIDVPLGTAPGTETQEVTMARVGWQLFHEGRCDGVWGIVGACWGFDSCTVWAGLVGYACLLYTQASLARGGYKSKRGAGSPKCEVPKCLLFEKRLPSTQ